MYHEFSMAPASPKLFIIILAFAAVLQAACAGNYQSSPPGPEQLLEFENASTSPVHVYARVGGGLIRVGWAPPGTTARLHLPVPAFSQISLVIVPGERLAAFRNFNDMAGVYTADPYPKDTALAHRWRFSGNNLMAIPLAPRTMGTVQ